jgi:hypothetical protein
VDVGLLRIRDLENGSSSLVVNGRGEYNPYVIARYNKFDRPMKKLVKTNISSFFKKGKK